MQLDKNTIGKLEQKSAAADAKIKELRAKLLEHVTVDSKSSLVIAAQYKDEAKKIVESIGSLESELTGLGEFIEKVTQAAAQLNCAGLDFQSRRSRFLSRLGQAEHSLKQEKMQLVPRLDKVDEFDRVIAESKAGIEKFDTIYLPLSDELAKLHD